MGRYVPAILCCCVLVFSEGCARTHYRLRADREAYAILGEKSSCGPWSLHDGFSVYPDPRSRFHDPSPVDDPALPIPAPQLYAYTLPSLPERDPARFRNELSQPHERTTSGQLTAQPSCTMGEPAEVTPALPAWPPVRLASYQTDTSPQQPAELQNEIDPQPLDMGEGLEELTILPIPADVWESLPPKCLARMLEFESVRVEYERTFERQPSEDQRDQSQRLALEDIVELAQINSREYQTEKEGLYDTALLLSLERFDYDLKFATTDNGTATNYTHNRAAGVTQDTLRVPTTATSERLLAAGGNLLAKFANEVVLTFNGPEGFAADVGSELFLSLSQAVFQRDIRFEALTQSERRVVYAARDYARFRKTLFSGLADRYYNLLLTYRAIEIASQDYFSNLRGFNQAKAEHEYRGLERFEVDQFEQRALTSRRGLISACNALERNLDSLKLDIGLPPELPLNLDLVELEELTLRDEVTAAAQRVQRAQRRLIDMRSRPEPQGVEMRKNAIRLVNEALSLQELPQRREVLNEAIRLANKALSLQELPQRREKILKNAIRLMNEALSLLELSQRREMLNEAIRLMNEELSLLELSQRREILNEAIRLMNEELSLQILRQRRGEEITNIDTLRTRLAILAAEETRLVVKFTREVLLEQRDADTPRPELFLIGRTMDLVKSLLVLAERELVVAERLGADAALIGGIRSELQQRNADFIQLNERMRLQKGVAGKQAEDILQNTPQFRLKSDQLLTDVEGLALEAESLMPPRTVDIDELIAQSQKLLDENIGGLLPVDIEMDDAMLTALTLRYDVMNQREQMADAWRRVKLTADDLKSILNLNASQSIRTRSDVNRPFDFTFDDSTTRLSMTFDAPLNRRLQRNVYRRQLINFNQAFRNLLELEDQIKFSIRNDLRELSVQSEQYDIAVASAALAYDRVVSTRKQFQKNVGDITARDVLESQQDYTASLVELAQAHIQYIQRRISLFLDLELLTVDDSGFWPELYDEEHQPTPNYDLPEYCSPAYGELPPGVLYSKAVKRMLHVPPGQSVIFRPADEHTSEAEEIPAPEAVPVADEDAHGGLLPAPLPD